MKGATLPDDGGEGVVRVRNGRRALLLVVCRTVAEQEKAQAQKQMHVASEGNTVGEQMNRLQKKDTTDDPQGILGRKADVLLGASLRNKVCVAEQDPSALTLLPAPVRGRSRPMRPLPFSAHISHFLRDTAS
jgi:hypothetical protein